MNRMIISAACLSLACSATQSHSNSAAAGNLTADDSPGATARGRECLTDASTPIDRPPNAPARIEVRHILVRHSELTDPKGASRTKQAACLQALEALQALQSGTVEWSAAVAKYGDSKDDDLGRVSADELDPAFAGAAFSLEVDQLSYVVETPRGFHVILRER